jgi:hypothetical protein
MTSTLPQSPIVILRNYFGFKSGQTLKQFSEEIKALSEEEKMELATLAAKELGVEVFV